MLSDFSVTEYSYLVSARFEAINSRYLELIAKQIKEIGRISPTNLHRLQQMAKVQQNIEEINKLLSNETNKTLEELYKVYDISGMSAYSDTFNLFTAKGITPLPFKDNMVLQGYLNSVKQLTQGTFINMANTTVLSDKYKELVDIAIDAVATGQTDYMSVIRGQMTGIANEGISVMYASGVKRRLDSAIRMNVLEGIRRVNEGVYQAAGEQFGADGVEISAHAICAPDHLSIQGKQFSKEQFAKVNTDLKRKISTCNCKHFIYPILLGISEPTYTSEELQQFRQNSEKKMSVNGKEMTLYEATQTMRKLETAMRYAKDLHIIGTNAGDKVLVNKANKRLNDLRATYRKVCADSGLSKKYERAYVPGFSGKQTAPKSITIKESGKSKNEVVINTQSITQAGMIVSKNVRIQKIQQELSKLPHMRTNPESLKLIDNAGDVVLNKLKASYGDDIATLDKYKTIRDKNKEKVFSLIEETFPDFYEKAQRDFDRLVYKKHRAMRRVETAENGESTFKEYIKDDLEAIKKYDTEIEDFLGNFQISDQKFFRDYDAYTFEYQKLYTKIRGKVSTNMDRMSDVLSEFRELGIQDVKDISKHLGNSKSPMRKIVESAYQRYPKEWVENSIDYGTLKPKTADRGYYAHYLKEIAISGLHESSQVETALHELGHRFERTQQLSTFEKLLYDKRTAGESLDWLGGGYAKTEKTRKDNWLDPYIGKDYGGDAYEIVSMGFEYAYTNPYLLMEDPEFARFILGLLVLF